MYHENNTTVWEDWYLWQYSNVYTAVLKEAWWRIELKESEKAFEHIVMASEEWVATN